MLRTKLIFWLILFAITAGAASAQTDSCFKNEGLKTANTVSFTLNGKNLRGTFVISSYDGSAPDETFEFAGTKTGSKLAITFAGKVPYETAPGSKRIIWTLSGSILRIPVYGKNYTTNKYSTYLADYAKCSES